MIFCSMFGLYHTLINWIGSFLSDRSIAVRVDGFLSNLHSINAGVPQGSVISPVLFILFINDLLTSTSSSIHSFADDTFLSSSFSFNPNYHASTDIQFHRNISASLLSNDLTVIEKWGKDNLVSFNQSKTKQAVISRKRNQNFPAVFMNGDELDASASFTQLGLSLSSNLTWKTHIHPHSFLLRAVHGTLRSLLQHQGLNELIFLSSDFFVVQLSDPYITTLNTRARTNLTLVSTLMLLSRQTHFRLSIDVLPSARRLRTSYSIQTSYSAS